MLHSIRPRITGLAILAAAMAPLAAPAIEAPYESRLLRLAEVLGSLHYLRDLCGEEGGNWRGQMEALLAAENPPPDRRARLVAGFNHGYRSFGGVYSSCTESAIEAISRYMKEGESLARDIAGRFGNSDGVNFFVNCRVRFLRPVLEKP